MKVATKSSRILKRKKSRSYDFIPANMLKGLVRDAFKEAADKTMEVMGYNVVADNGWVVKLYPDGHKEKISELPFINRNRPFILD